LVIREEMGSPRAWVPCGLKERKILELKKKVKEIRNVRQWEGENAIFFALGYESNTSPGLLIDQY
jgi:hypothetical protein